MDIEKIFREIQKNTNAEIYKVKTPHDKIQCVVCGGKYTRRMKVKHDKTEIHQNAFNSKKEKIEEILYDFKV